VTEQTDPRAVTPLAEDLRHILTKGERLLEELRGKHVFMTGGTGFFGCWLLESFARANDELGLNATACVLTRNPKRFAAKAPHLANHPAIRLHYGDIRSFEYPRAQFSFIIHAATQSGPEPGDTDPLWRFDSDVQGTRRVLDFARCCGAERLLFTSSGAIYGKQPPDMRNVPEDYSGAPDPLDPTTAYGQAKRVSEFMCTAYAKEHGLHTVIARCFAFVGPHLPLDSHFAIGNFIRDALTGGPIVVKGDGTPYRSYLYAADLAVWLWTLLLKGSSCRPYNVGSDSEITIADLARVVAEVCCPGAEVRFGQKAPLTSSAPRYVPSITRARVELGLQPWIGLREAIRRTMNWLGSAR